MYMKISGMEGDVSAKGYEQWIQLESLHLQARRKLNTQPGRTLDKEGSRPAFSEVTVTKRMDQTTPKLFQEALVGGAKPHIQIDIATSNDAMAAYMQYTFSNAILSSYEVHDFTFSSAGDSSHIKKRSPLETLTINFDKIEMRYLPRDTHNKPQSPVTAAYDLKQATSA
jgi:type VI secretion system secreted protein Hcp